MLISRTEDEFIESSLLGENRIVPTNGVRVSLIDFTLSRLTKGERYVVSAIHVQLFSVFKSSGFSKFCVISKFWPINHSRFKLSNYNAAEEKLAA